jgi:hypothetical protein
VSQRRKKLREGLDETRERAKNAPISQLQIMTMTTDTRADFRAAAERTK